MPKIKSKVLPKAPPSDQLLYATTSNRQPPRNPYYPDLGSDSHLLAPPPYGDLSFPTGTNSNSAMHPNYQSRVAPNRNVSVDIASNIDPVNWRLNRHLYQVRKFNHRLMTAATVALIASAYAHYLFQQRSCINFLVHQPSKDLSIRMYDIREMHLYVAYGSAVIVALSLIKALNGYRSSQSGYLFLMTVCTFIATLFTGYLSYLAYYSPCTVKPVDLINNIAKTFVSKFVDDMPSPERRVFGESNVFDNTDEDPKGVIIFWIDLFNFVLYLGGLLTATVLC